MPDQEPLGGATVTALSEPSQAAAPDAMETSDGVLTRDAAAASDGCTEASAEVAAGGGSLATTATSTGSEAKTGVVTDPVQRPLDDQGRFDSDRFASIEATLEGAGRVNDLVELHRFSAELAPDPAFGRRRLLSAGLLCFDRLQDPRRAEPYLRRALATAPGDLETMEALARVLVSLERFEEAASILERLAEGSEGRDKVRRLVALAELCDQKLGQADRAIEALHVAFTLDSTDVSILDRARLILAREDRWEDAKQVLDLVANVVLSGLDENAVSPASGPSVAADDENQSRAVSPGPWSQDVATAEVARPIATGTRTVADIAAAYRLLGVRLLANATKHPLAEACLERARALGDREALSKLDELAHLRQAWAERASAFRDEGFEARDKRKAAQLYLRAAELFHVYGKDPMRTEEFVERCMILCPGFEPALRFIEEAYLAEGRQDDLIKRLNGMAASVKDPAAKAQILLRVAEILERGLWGDSEDVRQDSHASASESGAESAAEGDAERDAEIDAKGQAEGRGESDADDHAERKRHSNALLTNEVIAAYRRALAVQPGNREAVARASALLEAQGQPAERTEVLEELLRSTDDVFVQTAVRSELGHLYAIRLGDSARARTHFEAILARNPNHFEAASALRALYKDAEEYGLLLGVLKILVDYAPDLSARVALLREVAAVAENVSQEEAFSAYRHIFEILPQDEDARAQLERLAADLGRYQALASTYVAAATGRSGALAANLWAQAGRVYEAHLPRPADAIRAFRTSLLLEPGHPEAEAALERLLREQDDPAALVEVLRTQLARTSDPEESVMLRAKIGEILGRELGDFDGALAIFEELLEKAPNSPTLPIVLASLDELYQRRGDWARLEAILAKRMDVATEPAELASLGCRRARVLMEHLGSTEPAASIYLDVVRADAANAEAVHALENFAREGVMRLDIARVLQDVFEKSGQFSRQVEMLRHLLDSELSPKARSALALKAARIAEERAQDLATAYDHAYTALDNDLESEEALALFVRLGVLAGMADGVARRLEQLLERPNLGVSAVASLATALGGVYEDALGARELAIASYGRAVKADGRARQAVAALERILGADSRWPELADLLAARIEAEDDPDAKVELGLALGAIREAHLGDREGAIDAFKAVLALQPKEATALNGLAEALDEAARYPELVEVLDQLRENAPDDATRSQLDVRVGDVFQNNLSDKAASFERYRRALALNPNARGAVRGLESLLREPAVGVAAAEVLEPLYLGDARWKELVTVLEVRLETVEGAEDRRALLLRLATILEENVARPEAAFDMLVKAFSEGWVDEQARTHLYRLANRAGRAPALATLYEEYLARISTVPSGEDLVSDSSSEARPAAVVRAVFLRELARLYDGPAADAGRARHAWSTLAELAPNDEEALAALERLHGAGDDPEALADVLMARSEASSSVDERVAFAKRAAVLYEDGADDPERAALALEYAAENNPNDRSTLQELARVYGELGRVKQQRDAMRREAELIEEPLAKANAFVAVAEQSLQLGETDEAIMAYEAGLRLAVDHQAARTGLEALLTSPDAPRAALALEPVYRTLGDWPRLVEVYEILAAASTDTQERVERLVAIRSIYEERLRQLEKAFSAASRAFLEMPSSDELLTAFERLGRASGNVEELLAILEDRAEALAPGSNERHALRLRIARLCESILRDRARILEAWNRVLAERSHDLSALKALEELHQKGGELRELAGVLRRQAYAVEAPEARVEILRQTAFLLDEKLGDRVAACALYEELLEVAPQDQRALGRLDAIYSETRAYEELGRVISEQLQHVEGPSRAPLLLRLGNLRRMHLDDPRSALSAFGEILAFGQEAGPAFDGALLAIEDLINKLKGKGSRPDVIKAASLLVEPHLVEKRDFAKVVAMKELRIATADTQDERRRFLLEVADVYETNLAQVEMAFVTMTRAFIEKPDEPDLADQIERLAKAADAHEELAELYAQVLPAIEDNQLALRFARRAAHIYDTQLQRGIAAIPLYRQVLTLVPDDTSALTALERLHRRAGQPEALVEVLRSMLRVAEDTEQQANLWEQIARILEEELHDLEGALDAYRALLALAPRNLRAQRAFNLISERQRRFSDLARGLQREIELLADEDEAVQVRLRLAAVLRDELGDFEAALEVYRDVLTTRAEDPGAIAGLVAVGQKEASLRGRAAKLLAPIYLGRGALDDYIACLESQVDDAEDSSARKALFERIAEIYETRFGKIEHAFTYYQRAFHEDPSGVDVRENLERLARENGLFEELAGYYLDELDDVSDRELRLLLHRRVAHIYDRELEAARHAISEYSKILDLEPADPDALRALERLYRQAGSFGLLADVYRRRIAQSEDDEVRVALMREFARLQIEDLDDTQGATATLRRLLEIEPNDVEALRSLARLCGAQGRSAELADVLGRILAVVEKHGPIALEAMLDLARVKETRLGDLGGAYALYREILAADPTHEATRDHLEERLQDAMAEEDLDLATTSSELLTDAMRRSEEWQPLVAVLRLWASVARSDLERVPMTLEVARVYRDRLEQPELAFAAFCQVYESAPGLAEVRDELCELGQRLFMVEKLVDVLRRGLAGVVDSEVALDIERRIARLIEAQLGDRDKAAEAWQAVLARVPDDEDALLALDKLYLALGRWGALTDVLEARLAGAASDDERFELNFRVGTIWDECLGEPSEALEYFRAARRYKPSDKDTLLVLSRLLTPEEDPEELEVILRALIEQADDDREQLRLRPRLAELLGALDDRSSDAIDEWRLVLELDPRSAAARLALETLYEAEGRWVELAEHLETGLRDAWEEKDVLRLQRKLALVKGTRLGSIDEAIRSWAEILRRNPNDLEAHRALRQIYRDAGRWTDLVQTLRRLVPLQSDAESVKDLRFELSEVYLDKLRDNDEAIEAAKRVFDVEPHTLDELVRLEDIFVRTGAYAEAVKVLQARVAITESDGEKIDLLFEVARHYEQNIGRRAGAASAYERILEIAPDSAKAYDALTAMFEATGEYRKLVELYNRRLDVTEAADARRKLLFAIIDVQERWLGHPALAFTAAVRAFGEEGADAEAQAIAERLAEETGSWEDLADVFEVQIGEVNVARALELRRRLGEICREHLEDLERAEEQFTRVLEYEPEDEVARRNLIELLEMGGRWGDLVQRLDDESERTSDEVEKKRIFRRIAEIEEGELDNIEGAIASLKRILDFAPDDREALLELVRIFRRTERWHPLLNALERRLQAAHDDDERVAIRFEIAGVYERGLGNTEHAIEAYRDVLAVDGRHPASLAALERLYTQAERWDEAIEIHERQAEASSSAEEEVAILARIASIQEEHFDDLERASATLVRVLEVQPDHLPTIRELQRIWRQTGAWENLVEAYERHIELATKPEELVELHTLVGDVYQTELGASAKADEAYRRALSVDPRALAPIHALGELHEKEGRWSEALDLLAREGEILGFDPTAATVHFRMGRINEEMLIDRDAAVAAYSKALDVDPGFERALIALRGIYSEDDDLEKVVVLTAQQADHTDDPEARAGLFFEAGRITEEDLEDLPQAIELFLRALDASPGHIESLASLADIYFDDERWADAQSLLERLVERLDPGNEDHALYRQHYRLAYIAEKLGDDARALDHYLISYELNSLSLPTLEGLGAALLRAERWEDAQRIFQTILVHHRTKLTEAEVVDLHYQLGELASKLGQLDRARSSFEKALSLDDIHQPTLRAYAELAEITGDWEESYDLRERLISQLDGDEKRDALVHQAKLCEEKIKEPYRAIDAYVGAKKLADDNVEILRALVRLFNETHQAQHAIEMLKELTALLRDATERRDVFLELARIFADEQSLPQEAVDALNKALDVDPMYLTAFERIEQILYRLRDWTGLEDNYHRMLKRIPKEQIKARCILWRSLGDLYLKVLKNEEGARVAYDVVLKMDPSANDVSFALADLCRRRRETAPRAVELYHGLVVSAEDPAVPARALFELYHALGHRDRAFCALGALLLMRAATEDETRAYEMLLKRGPSGASRPLTDSLWRSHVLHPDCRNSLADILSLVYRGAPDLFGQAQEALNLKRKKERVDLSSKEKNERARLRYFDIWRRLAAVMSVADMEHYHRTGSTAAPRLYPGEVPALFAGEEHEVFRAMPPRQIAWMLARQMATARPELAVVQALPPAEVGAVIEAVIVLFTKTGSGIDMGFDAGLVQSWTRALNRSLSESALKALGDPVRLCLQRRELKRLSRFLEGAEHTASRAALLMAGDVSVAERGLSESDQLVDMSFRKRVRGLMLFTLSPEHFDLRQRLGLIVS
ncbi:MAG: tetratricopeptide repeat protein [Deltaproteobacteria bacterium]|nr:tetratricopeptide repeat protein [Deltaproteobacteria bacterium]